MGFYIRVKKMKLLLGGQSKCDKECASIVNTIKSITLYLFLSLPLHAQDFSDTTRADWVPLFNKVNLDGWIPKVNGYEAGVNHQNTWIVKDSLLVTDYADYEGDYKQRFGHMGYEERTFSYFMLRVQYQFFGELYKGGPNYGKFNSGIMWHSESVTEMGVDQAFPNSIETQLLGPGNIFNDGYTATLCTVEQLTSVVIDGERQSICNKGTQEIPIDGLEWVTVELLVLGDSLGMHIVEGNVAMVFTDFEFEDGTPRSEGYISIQSEAQPIKFKTIEIMLLEGCMDQAANNYRKRFIKNLPESCDYTAPVLRGVDVRDQIEVRSLVEQFSIYNPGTEKQDIKVFNLQGTLVTSLSLAPGATNLVEKDLHTGVYHMLVKSLKGDYHKRFLVQ
ncbi:MAG: DUF1080 domain-containing protein [Flavobacteriales bacterium]|nr:DUF1080 domain-containing protein [Flavobacteriales bacterium]